MFYKTTHKIVVLVRLPLEIIQSTMLAFLATICIVGRITATPKEKYFLIETEDTKKSGPKASSLWQMTDGTDYENLPLNMTEQGGMIIII